MVTYRKGCKIDVWFKHYTNSDNPETFMNATGSAIASGYKAKRPESFGEIGYQNSKKLQNKINQWLDEAELSDAALKTRLLKLLTASETKFFQHQGMVTEERVVPALETQRRTLDMAFRVKGLYQKDNEQSSGIAVIYPPTINKPAHSGR